MKLPDYVVINNEQQKSWAEIHLNGTREDWVAAYEEIKALNDAVPEREATTRESLNLNQWMHAFYFIKDIIPFGTVMVRREDYRPEDDPDYEDFSSLIWESEAKRFLITEHCVSSNSEASGVWISDADTGENMGLCNPRIIREYLREESKINDQYNREGCFLVQDRLVQTSSITPRYMPEEMKTRQVYDYFVCDKNGTHMMKVQMDPWEASAFAAHNDLTINRNP